MEREQVPEKRSKAERTEAGRWWKNKDTKQVGEGTRRTQDTWKTKHLNSCASLCWILKCTFRNGFYCSWFTMFCQFPLYSKATQSYIYTHSFSYIIFHRGLFPRDWIEFPVLDSRTSLLIHSKGNSLHLPTPNSHPSHSLPSPLATISLLLMSVSLFLDTQT